ncbi:DUF2141 domain-containing protein [Sphingomonas sp. PB4P5]|uniref:DUF2141 domain-containing protein n=1 Tax=Parasphingomonas puruogangriensis TaxID=3096155 RepID=UPI002FC74ABA
MILPMLALLAVQSGPAAAQCAPGTQHPVLVKITGFKNRTGQVRVRLFGGSTATYFDKKQVLVRTEIATPRGGAVTICVAAPRPGVYAVDVRHDVNGNGKTDRADGGGTSGNPDIGLMDVIFKRKPSPAITQIRVGNGPTAVAIQLKYLQGGSFKPVAAD